MDQKFVSGIGNIYANEILFFSQVKPMRKVKNLKDVEELLQNYDDRYEEKFLNLEYAYNQRIQQALDGQKSFAEDELKRNRIHAKKVRDVE